MILKKQIIFSVSAIFISCLTASYANANPDVLSNPVSNAAKDAVKNLPARDSEAAERRREFREERREDIKEFRQDRKEDRKRNRQERRGGDR